MPVRIGFTQFRKQMLERELDNIEQLLPTLGVEKVILTGDMVSEVYSPDSRIDLIGSTTPTGPLAAGPTSFPTI